MGASALTGPQEERLRALRRDYAAKLPERIRKLAEGVEAVFSDAHGQPPRPRLEELFHQAHRLSGSAAIFGFEEVRSAAQGLEDLLLSFLEEGEDDDRRVALIGRLELLRSALLADPEAAAEARANGLQAKAAGIAERSGIAGRSARRGGRPAGRRRAR